MESNCTRALSLLLIVFIISCRASNESVRGQAALKGAITADVRSDGSSNRDVGTQTITPSEAPILVDENIVQSLKLVAELDQTGLPQGFIDDIFALHKIAPQKTILFGKSNQSWLLDESKDGAMSKLALDVTLPAGNRVYVLENKNFWMLSKTTVSFPSTVPSTDPGQLTLINLAPEIIKDPNNTARVLFAGPQRLILANEQRANIIILDGDKARVVALEFPKVDAAVPQIMAAGLVDGSDSFWFLSSDRLFLLKRSNDGQWRWVINKFKLEGEGLPPEPSMQVAMLIDSKDDKTISYIGRSFELVGGKLYGPNATRLSLVEDAKDPAQDPEFVNVIQPLLKSSCVGCHPGYDEFATMKAKAATFKQRIGDGSMPQGMALTPEQIKTLTHYLTKVIAMP